MKGLGMPDFPKSVTFSPLTIDDRLFPWYVHDQGVTYYPPQFGTDGRMISMGRLVLELIVDEHTSLTPRAV